jgi:hypothetical protein
MDWFKVKVSHCLYSNFSSSEKAAWLDIMALTTHLEREPNEQEMLKVCHHKTLRSLQERLKEQSTDLQGVVKKVLRDVQEALKERERWKDRKRQQREKNDVVPRDVPRDVPRQSRVEKSIVEKSNNNSPAAPDQTVEKELTPTQKFVEAWGDLYKSKTGLPYHADRKDFIIVTNLIKKHTIEVVTEKAKILFDLCSKQSAWFTKGGISDFTIGKLSNRWNNITEEASNDGKQFNNREATEWLEKRASARAGQDAGEVNTENIAFQKH